MIKIDTWAPQKKGPLKKGEIEGYSYHKPSQAKKMLMFF